MSIIKNPWVGYLERSYTSIKNALLQKVTTSNPELTDHSESNIFVIIISMFSGIAESLNYYIDNMAKEGFIMTASRRSSVIRHSQLLDYRIKARSPESADVIYTFKDGGVETALPSDVTIPAGTSILSDTDNYTYRSTEDVTVTAGNSSATVAHKEVTIVTGASLGNTNGNANQQIVIPSNYVDGSMTLFVDGLEYTRLDSWSESDGDDISYIINQLPNNSFVIEFGDDTRGAIPNTGLAITANYQITEALDRSIPANDLTIPPSLSLPGTFTLEVTNPQASSGGSFVEDTEEIRRNAIFSRRTNDRMVTKTDYKTLIEALSGVGAAGICFACTKTLDVYIAPEGGGLASGALLTSVDNLVDAKKMAGLAVQSYAAGETFIVIQLTATAERNQDLITVKSNIETALTTFGSVSNQAINKAIRISDITSTVHNLADVDFMELDVMYAKPYARPRSHSNQIIWTSIQIKTGSVSIQDYTLKYSSGQFTVIRGRTYMGTVAEDATYSDDVIEFVISSTGSYSNSNVWNFKTYPYNESIVLEDFTLPRIQISDLTVVVNEQTDGATC